jgi:mRNA interferase YafQ
MRAIKLTSRFKKDYKRESKGMHRKTLDSDLLAVVSLLAADELLPLQHRDHQLRGEWDDHRDCHIKPDPVLIYRLSEAESLELVRLGSHSELSL